MRSAALEDSPSIGDYMAKKFRVKDDARVV